MPVRAESFEDHYRTRDGEVLFMFRFQCDANSSSWRFSVKYGDPHMTQAPSVFHDPGNVLYANSRDELLREAARWAESLHAFYQAPAQVMQREPSGPETVLEAGR